MLKAKDKSKKKTKEARMTKAQKEGQMTSK